MKSAVSRAAKMRLLVGTGLAVTAMPLAAQEAEQASGATIGEIVVTAQKREQNLQEVPLAISVLGADKLQQLQVNDARDLTGLAPNVTVVTGQSSNNAAVISMRGITSPAGETFGLDTANALYLDLLNQHKLANLTRKFKKSEWLAAMATALNTLKASAPVSK